MIIMKLKVLSTLIFSYEQTDNCARPRLLGRFFYLVVLIKNCISPTYNPRYINY